MTGSRSSTPPASTPLARLLGYLQEDPENHRLRADVFDAALAAGQFDIAQQQTAAVLARHPADWGWRHRLAVLDLAQHQWDEAVLLLQALIDEGQHDPAIVYNLAYADFARGHLSEAIARLQPLLASDFERLPESLTLLLRCLHRQGAIDEGLALFESYRARCSSAHTWGVASLLAVDGDQFGNAGNWASQALALDPRQLEARVAKATLLLARRDATGALALLSEVLERQPNEGRALSAAGMAWLLRGDFPMAHDVLMRAVAAMPRHIGTWHALAWCHIVRQDLRGAQEAFEHALALDHNFGESHGGLAVVQALGGEMALAQESIRRALRLAPDGLAAHYAQAVLDGDVRDPQRFSAMARALLASHRDGEGRSLADVLLKPR